MNNLLQEELTLPTLTEKEEIRSYYLKLNEKIAELTQLKNDLKKIIPESLKTDFLLTKTSYKFAVKDIRSLPFEYLKVDTAKLSNLYTSISGGKSFLKQYGLKVTKVSTEA